MRIPSSLYCAILTVEVLLAMTLFTVALGITIPWPALTAMQEWRPFWMTVNLVLATIIVSLSTFLRRL